MLKNHFDEIYQAALELNVDMLTSAVRMVVLMYGSREAITILALLN